MQVQTERAAIAVPTQNEIDHEATKQALRSDLQAGKLGIGGAIASYPGLTILEIVKVASELNRAS